MNVATRPAIRHALALTLAAVLLPLGALGCSAPQESADLTIRSLGQKQEYNQCFPQAYAGRDQHGDYDVVLACSPTQVASGHATLRQLMHIRVLWAPDGAVKVDGPVTTNAAIHWYVFTESRTPELIEYSGTGMVTIEPDGAMTNVKVENASLNPTFNRGDLTDPIGPSRFGGKIVARTSRARVNELLSEVRTNLASAALDHSETAGGAAVR